MMRSARLVVALGFGVLLAAPVAAGADPLSAWEKVEVRTDRADAGLERAVALFEAGRDARAARSLGAGQAELGKATAAAAKLSRTAETAAERQDAAKALGAVASTRDDAVETLVAALDEASGKPESAVAQAALADTRGREKALSLLAVLAGELPDHAQAGVAKAIAALSTDRAPEASAEAAALASDKVSAKSKRALAKALDANLDGQVAAAARIQSLLASDALSDAAKAGLEQAYAAVTADHAAAAAAVDAFSDHMPEWVRSFVDQVVAQAKEDATQMREAGPAPPTPPTPEPPVQGGQQDGTPAGPPADPGRP
jgi:hypothetical protein